MVVHCECTISMIGYDSAALVDSFAESKHISYYSLLLFKLF